MVPIRFERNFPTFGKIGAKLLIKSELCNYGDCYSIQKTVIYTVLSAYIYIGLV